MSETSKLVPSFKLEDFEEGCTLLVDKPLDWTSFDVVHKIRSIIRKKLDKKNVKVGHSGTLDPKATGLLILCVGKATKRLSVFQNYSKEYVGTMYLGATTPSFDSETRVDRVYSTEHLTAALLEQTAAKFLGIQNQIPPAYSAIKKNGERSYLAAREGRKLDLRSREINIGAFDILSVDLPYVDFKVYCSKGTYIRSLVHDFGKSANSGAYLKSLKRTKIGPFHLKNSWTVENLVQQINLV